MELSHLLGSVAGIGLVLLARGLFRRLDTAWLVTMGLLAASVVLQILKGVDYEEALVMPSSWRPWRRVVQPSIAKARYWPNGLPRLGRRQWRSSW
jgi:lysylphosphatidylglycerol synthetase-like protein (DUF2156 family)